MKTSFLVSDKIVNDLFSWSGFCTDSKSLIVWPDTAEVHVCFLQHWQCNNPSSFSSLSLFMKKQTIKSFQNNL